MSSLKDKNIIVTGASGGIGNSIVEKFYENGANVLATGTNIEKLEKLKKQFKNIKILKFDISQHEKIEEFINSATIIMNEELSKLNFTKPKNKLISNVTGNVISNTEELKKLLIKQIESSVRWRESALLMIEKGVTEFIEIGPGRVLSGLIKRIDKNVKVSAINSEEDIKLININE